MRFAPLNAWVHCNLYGITFVNLDGVYCCTRHMFCKPFRTNLLEKLTDCHVEDVLQKQHEQIISVQRQKRDKLRILCDARLWYDDLGRLLYMALDDSLTNVISMFLLLCHSTLCCLQHFFIMLNCYLHGAN